MKTKIPQELKEDMPSTRWGKILSATPVVMTVIATMLAGLSSSEMTRAQYDRSMAAQEQSKAGDQWNFFQGKKLRGAVQRNTLDMIASTSTVNPLNVSALRQALAATPASGVLDSPNGLKTLALLVENALPRMAPPPALESNVAAALHALEESRPEEELYPLINRVDDLVLESTVRSARAQALDLDALTKPIGQTIDTIERALAETADTSALRRDFTAARLAHNTLRYDAEARLNQTVASLYEIQVRKSNLSAERHHRRSARFFYGMLAAQMGVIISTLAMAARKRNLLWSLAAGAGVVAIAFAVYVYVYV